MNTVLEFMYQNLVMCNHICSVCVLVKRYCGCETAFVCCITTCVIVRCLWVPEFRTIFDVFNVNVVSEILRHFQ